MTSAITHVEYVGDSRGTKYDVFQSCDRENNWALVVCEDRPGIYRNLLEGLVRDGVVGLALSIPFSEAGRRLLQEGHTRIGEQPLRIPNVRQCCLVLDMAASPGGCDLEGIDDSTLAFAGAEFFSTLPRHVREKTVLWSRVVPLPAFYYDRYPELQLANQRTFPKETQDTAEAGGLTETSCRLVAGFVTQIRKQSDRCIFEPLPDRAGSGTARKGRKRGDAVCKVRIAFAGWGPVEVNARRGAQYLYLMLRYPGRELDTAKVCEALGGMADEGAPSVSFEDGLQVARRTSRGVAGLDEEGVRRVCREAERLLNDKMKHLLSWMRSGAGDEEDSEQGESGDNAQVKTIKSMINGEFSSDALRSRVLEARDADVFGEVAKLIRSVGNSGYKVTFQHDGECWRIMHTPFRQQGGRRDGEKITYPASETIRRGVIRFVRDEIEPVLPALAEHLLGKQEAGAAASRSLQLSSYRTSCRYTGSLTWFFGPHDSWNIPVTAIAWGPAMDTAADDASASPQADTGSMTNG
jgi:hypothetical protein